MYVQWFSYQKPSRNLFQHIGSMFCSYQKPAKNQLKHMVRCFFSYKNLLKNYILQSVSSHLKPTKQTVKHIYPTIKIVCVSRLVVRAKQTCQPSSMLSLSCHPSANPSGVYVSHGCSHCL
jgi:hypothetical protein